MILHVPYQIFFWWCTVLSVWVSGRLFGFVKPGYVVHHCNCTELHCAPLTWVVQDQPVLCIMVQKVGLIFFLEAGVTPNIFLFGGLHGTCRKRTVCEPRLDKQVMGPQLSMPIDWLVLICPTRVICFTFRKKWFLCKSYKKL